MWMSQLDACRIWPGLNMIQQVFSVGQLANFVQYEVELFMALHN